MDRPKLNNNKTIITIYSWSIAYFIITLLRRYCKKKSSINTTDYRGLGYTIKYRQSHHWFWDHFQESCPNSIKKNRIRIRNSVLIGISFLSGLLPCKKDTVRTLCEMWEINTLSVEERRWRSGSGFFYIGGSDPDPQL